MIFQWIWKIEAQKSIQLNDKFAIFNPALKGELINTIKTSLFIVEHFHELHWQSVLSQVYKLLCCIMKIHMYTGYNIIRL
jgi:hypothetical protein